MRNKDTMYSTLILILELLCIYILAVQYQECRIIVSQPSLLRSYQTAPITQIRNYLILSFDMTIDLE
jgi:Ni,Fe-hydrogenase I cytochrome b subunit